MILFLLAYVGGVLTITSLCILPVLPFVFARADRPFVRSLPARACRHGGHLRRRRHAGGSRRRMGGRSQPLWPVRAISDRTFEIRFLDLGVQAYAFTFG